MKIKDILKKMGIIKKEKEPIISPLGEAIMEIPKAYNALHSNMYDLFVKKTIDVKKDIHEYDGDDKIDWNSTYEGPKVRKFTIPVNGLSREEAEDQIKKLMSEYHEDVEWAGDGGLDTFGETPINRVYSDLDPYGEENWNEDNNTNIPY